jgi:hypothetical protein
MKKIMVHIGENMDKPTIYLRKLANLSLRFFLPPIYKNERLGDIRNLGLAISPASKSTSEVIFTATEVTKLNF